VGEGSGGRLGTDAAADAVEGGLAGVDTRSSEGRFGRVGARALASQRRALASQRLLNTLLIQSDSSHLLLQGRKRRLHGRVAVSSVDITAAAPPDRRDVALSSRPQRLFF
jgi:hypothetical protein